MERIGSVYHATDCQCGSTPCTCCRSKKIYPDWLSDYLYLGNKDYDESLVRVALVEESGELKLPGGEPVSGKFDIKYNSNIGYQVIKRRQSDNEQSV